MNQISPLISVRGLSYRYEDNLPFVLNDVDLNINQGEFIAFVGQNGAGKTTLVKHFNGLLLPTTGEVLLDGKNTKSLSIEEIARKVGYCYQNPDHQIFGQTVRDEVTFGPKNIGMKGDQLEKSVDHALELVGLETFSDRYPFMLGRGERQKLAVASILAMQPSVLIVDEPTTGMDFRGSQSIMKLLSEWHDQGQTIMVITHDMNIVAEFVPTVVIMSEGKVLAKAPTRDVMKDSKLLESAFLRPPQATRIAQKLSNYGIRDDVLTVSELKGEFNRLLNRN